MTFATLGESENKMQPVPNGASMQLGEKRAWTIEDRSLKRIQRHLAENYPNEACGILFCHSENPRYICAVREANNTTAEDPANRYLIDPLDFLAADQWAEKKGLDIYGFYHSHPDHPAIPSEHDRKLAWGGYLYLIVSIKKAGPEEARAWIYEPEDKQFYEVAFTAIAIENSHHE